MAKIGHGRGKVLLPHARSTLWRVGCCRSLPNNLFYLFVRLMALHLASRRCCTKCEEAGKRADFHARTLNLSSARDVFHNWRK